MTKFYFSPPHGEFSRNIFEELFDFRAKSWRSRFHDTGFEVVSIVPGGIIYSGNAVFGRRLPVAFRKRLSTILGSSTYYILVTRVR